MGKFNEMESGKISSLLLKFSLPAIVGMLVNAMYNVVDSAFIGRGVGDLALAGVTVSLPIMTIFMACVMLIGMGATSLISIRMGEKNEEDAEKIIGNALILFVIIGLVLTVFGLIFLEPILTVFGASPDVLPFAVDYMRVILLGSVFMAVGLGMNNFIRAEGNPKIAMNTMLIGAITNIVLDYIFIFKFHWGIKGAAFATILSYTVTSTWVLYHFLKGNSKLKIKIKNLRLNGVMVKGILIVGFPTFAMQVTSSIQHMILNRSLAHHGGDMALAAVGIIMSVSTLLVMPAMGISQGAQPIIGYNYGAKKYGRVKDTLKLAIVSATSIVTIGFLISVIWPAQLIGLFNENPELIALGTHAMGIFFKFLPLIGIQLMSANYFQAIGKPKQATILSLSRQVFIFIPLLVILPMRWGLEGIWWSSPMSDIAAFFVTGIWLWVEIRHLSKTEELYNKKILEEIRI